MSHFVVNRHSQILVLNKWAVVKAISSEQWAFWEYPYIGMLPPSTMVRPPQNQKSEIKVYLPLKLIGELEGKKRAGMRSKFIEKAIKEKLARIEKSTLDDYSDLVLLCASRDRMLVGTLAEEIIQVLIDWEMKE